MKTIIFYLELLIALGCQKADDDPVTKYVFMNDLGETIYDFTGYSLDQNSNPVDVNPVGILQDGAATVPFQTSETQVYFSYRPDNGGGIVYYSADNYFLGKGWINAFRITPMTTVIYPGAESTYYIVNNFDYIIQDVTSGYFTGSSMTDSYNHRNLEYGERSFHIPTGHKSIRVTFISFSNVKYRADFEISTTPQINRLDLTKYTVHEM